MFKFENLAVWRKSIELIGFIDFVVKKFPKDEVYVLSSQIKRASDSIALNIAEGSQGQSNPEFSKFIGYAIRSAIEVVCCIHIAKTREIISKEDFDKIYEDCEVLIKMLQSLRITLNK
jgi:four helix bundle protein